MSYAKPYTLEEMPFVLANTTDQQHARVLATVRALDEARRWCDEAHGKVSTAERERAEVERLKAALEECERKRASCSAQFIHADNRARAAEQRAQNAEACCVELEKELESLIASMGEATATAREEAREEMEEDHERMKARVAVLKEALRRAIEGFEAVRHSNLARGHAACDDILPELSAALLPPPGEEAVKDPLEEPRKEHRLVSAPAPGSVTLSAEEVAKVRAAVRHKADCSSRDAVFDADKDRLVELDCDCNAESALAILARIREGREKP